MCDTQAINCDQSKVSVVKKLLTYHKPRIYNFGSLEKVQAGATGGYNDGPTSSYYYNR